MKGLQTIQSCKGNTSNLYHMAVTSLKQGKLDLAISCLARVCELGEARALDHFTYAEALRRAGRHEEALAAARRGAAKDPSFAAGWETLGSVYAAAGRLTEALDSFKKAVSLNPRSVIALNNLGLVSQAMGQFKEAEVSYRHALTLAPDNQEIKINLASQQGLSGNPHAGLDLIKEVLERGPANLQALLLGSMLAIEADHYDLCLIWAEKILAIAPGHPTALHHRGLALQGLDRLEAALEAFDQAAKRAPKPAAPLTSKASLLAETGDKQAALEMVQKAILSDHHFTPAWHLRTTLTRYKPGDPDVAAMEQLYANPCLSGLDRLNLAFCLGKAYLDIEDGDLAFSYFATGGQIKRKMVDYDPADDEQRFALIKATFSAEAMKQFGSTGVTSDRSIFVFGMPRSGTTLIEQILASHPLVRGLGETNHLPNIVSAPGFLDGLSSLKPEHFHQVGGHYLDLASANVPPTVRFVDKMPSNFHHAGLIALSMPGAKMIHSRRDPLDTCLSCYTTLFAKGHQYTYNLEELGQYYRQYLSLMEHWRQALPEGVLLEVDYESLVANPEPEVRRVLDFCHLPWDDACLRFYETRRRVTTASLAQVRQPIYLSSVGRAKKFRPWLGQLEAVLEMAV